MQQWASGKPFCPCVGLPWADRHRAYLPWHPQRAVKGREFLLPQSFFFPQRHSFGMLQSLGCKNFNGSSCEERMVQELRGGWVGGEGIDEFIFLLGLICPFNSSAPPFWVTRFPISEQICWIPPAPVSIFLSLCHLLALPSLRENSDTLTCINRSWEIAKLFFAKYVFLGSARPQMCSKAADIGFPLSHSGRKYVILSLPLHVSCPQGTQWHN